MNSCLRQGAHSQSDIAIPPGFIDDILKARLPCPDTRYFLASNAELIGVARALWNPQNLVQ